MEILVVTLAYTKVEHNTDVLARIQWIADTLHNAPGLVSSRFYRNRESGSSYLIFTTWEDEESWQRAQERYNPKILLLGSAIGLLTASPEQWQMHYLWGYHRPTITPTIAAVHLATLYSYQAEISQQKWINELRKQDMKRTLGFAFLARGRQEGASADKEKRSLTPAPVEDYMNSSSSIFLNLFSWGSETECRMFYANPVYKELDNAVRSMGVMHILFLEPM